MKKIQINSQEDFDKAFEKTIESMNMSWKLLKEIILEYPDYYDAYCSMHNYKLNIRKLSKCDGCQWNDGCPHGACWSCDD